MSFKFNFGPCDTEKRSDVIAEERTTSHGNAQAHHCNARHCKVNEGDGPSFLSLVIGDVDLRYLSPLTAEERVHSSAECGEISSVLQHSDLASGCYEGGLKVWECTFDLLQYLSKNKNVLADSHKVLDLGCGCGLLGIYMTMCVNCDRVCLQDFNSHVIDFFTIPNALQTVKNAARPPHTTVSNDENIYNDEITSAVNHSFSFVSGDWDAMCDEPFRRDTMPAKNFDTILSSETIYNTEYYPKLQRVLETYLSHNGAAYFAAKTHYFGVGGGTFDFTEFLERSGSFCVDSVFASEVGLSREILKVTWKR